MDFRFVINKKEKSKVTFKAKLLNNTRIELFAYDDLADYIYRENLKTLLIRGKINNNMQIEIIEIYNFK